jgi:hypothetical protein
VQARAIDGGAIRIENRTLDVGAVLRDTRKSQADQRGAQQAKLNWPFRYGTDLAWYPAKRGDRES